MDKAVFFSLKRKLSVAKQEAFLDALRKWEGVSGAGHIEPESTDADDLRACFAYLNPGSNEEEFMRRLRRERYVETASVQPYRYAAAV